MAALVEQTAVGRRAPVPVDGVDCSGKTTLADALAILRGIVTREARGGREEHFWAALPQTSPVRRRRSVV